MSNLTPFKRKIKLATTGIRSKKLGTWEYATGKSLPERVFRGKLLTR